MSYQVPIFPAMRKSVRQRIFTHIATHPGANSRQLAQEFGIPVKTVCMHLAALREDGKIRKVAGPATYARGWEIGMCGEVKEERSRPDRPASVPTQRIVTEWEPHLLRDPLVAALFGR